MSKVLPTCTCPECHELFTPIPRRRDGGLPPACPDCIRRYNWKQHPEVGRASLRAAGAAKKANARARLAAQLQETFGVISDREAALFAFGVQVGYNRGYETAYHRRPGTQVGKGLSG